MPQPTYFDEPEQQPQPANHTVVRWVAKLFPWLMVAALAAVAVMPSPYLIESPGPVFNVLGDDGSSEVITVSGTKTYPVDGALDLLTVNLEGGPGQTAKWYEAVLAMMNPSMAVVPVDEMYPKNVSTTQVEQSNTAMMQDSQSSATATALRALGYRFGTLVYVAGITKGSPADGVLKPDDVIEFVNGKSVTTFDELRAMVQKSKGKAITVSYLRNGKTSSVALTPKQIDGAWRIGVLIGNHYKFPINVKLSLSNVGGPSGGMMFALGIYDKLTPGSLTGGEIIAGTGTIDDNGVVGEIGGIRQKMFGAVRGGAKFFLAPKGNCNEVVGHVPNGLQVVKVSNFSQALAAVKQIGTRHNVSGLPTCTK
ncbi:MAG: PDZ domain-containing protein [Micrococcales bacterium]